MTNITSKPVIVVGAGGHAKVVADALIESNRKILGLLDPNKKAGEVCFGLRILGADDHLDEHDPNDIELANGVGALPGNTHRWEVASSLRAKGYKFTTVVHPTAVLASSATLSEGVQVMAGCVIQSSASIGQDSIVNTGSLIDHDCVIGSNCHIAPGVILSGCVQVGDDTHVGTGVVVIQSIVIGSNSVVAAGSVLYRDVNSDINYLQARHVTESPRGI